MCQSMVDIQSAAAEIRRGKKEEERNSMKKVWLTPTTGVPCSNAAKTRNPLKLAGVPQTTGWI